MRSLTYQNANPSLAPRIATQDLPLTATKTIPFDYVFEFKLTGKSANNVQDVVKLAESVEISMQGTFVGVSIGYSFLLDERKSQRGFAPVLDTVTTPQPPVLLGTSPNGSPFTLSSIVIVGTPNTEVTVLALTDTGIQKAVLNGNTLDFMNTLGPPPPGQTDRLPLGNSGIASFTFNGIPPNSVVRVWDRRSNLLSQPFNVAEIAVGPDPVTRKLPVAGDQKFSIYGLGPLGAGSVSARIFLLDGSTGITHDVEDPAGTSTFDLTVDSVLGMPVGRKEINLFVNGQPRQLAGGDVLIVQKITTPTTSQNLFTVPNPSLANVSLGAIAKGLAGANQSLTSGVRLSQRAANIFAADPPLSQIDPTIVSTAFEPIGGAEDVRFLYSIDVVGTGRELQNKPIHNIAGLGVANGDRPFRTFATPIAFEPRSVIRIQIEELSTLPGTLYMVLQGYKILGTGRVPQ